MIEFTWLLLFWLGFLGVLHSYVIYPLVLRIMAGGKGKANLSIYGPNDSSWPAVSVLMAVHNEEKVLERKLKHLLALEYHGEIQILVGSDCSTDQTNAIGERFARSYANLIFFPFSRTTW